MDCFTNIDPISKLFFVFFLRQRHTNLGLEIKCIDLSHISSWDCNNLYSLPTSLRHEIQEIGGPLPTCRYGISYLHRCNELHMGFHSFVSLLRIFIQMLILVLQMALSLWVFTMVKIKVDITTLLQLKL